MTTKYLKRRRIKVLEILLVGLSISSFLNVGGMVMESFDKLPVAEKKKFEALMQEISFAGLPPRLAAQAMEEKKCYDILQKCRIQLESTHNECKLKDDKENFLALTQAYLHDYDESTGPIMGSDFNAVSVTISENPMATILMLRRFAIQLEPLKDINNLELFCPEFQSQAEHISVSTGWPSKLVFGEGANRLFRIQHIYNFPAQDIAIGKLGTIETKFGLPIEACFDLGVIALEFAYYTLAYEWLTLAETKLTKSSSSSHLTIEMIETQKQILKEKHDANWEVWTPRNMQYQQYFFDTRFEDCVNRTEQPVPRRTSLYDRKLLDEGKYEWIHVTQYWALCFGEKLQKEEYKSKLYCWHETKIHPTYTIGPLKMELLSGSPDPDIIQIYDLFGDTLCSKLRMLTMHRVGSSIVGALNTNPLDLLDNRSSLQGTLEEPEGEERAQIINILRRITDLTIRSERIEPTYFLMYGFGGHVRYHADRNRILPYHIASGYPDARYATALLYLSDVEAGGETAFFGPRVTAEPVKGSAVLWWNVFSDVSLDPSNIHAGCPVILGEKFGGNQWIPSGDQMFNHKCSLNGKERLRYPVNGKIQR